jgi:hypothetical protein
MYLKRILTAWIILLAASLQVFAQDGDSLRVQSETPDFFKSIHLFPNPAVEYVNVKVDHVNASDIRVTLHNIIGNEMSIETEIIDEHTLRVRVKDFPVGYYLLALRDKNSRHSGTFKFVKR